MTTNKNNALSPSPIPAFSRIVQKVASKTVIFDRHEIKAGIIAGLRILASVIHAHRAVFINVDPDGSTVSQHLEWHKIGLEHGDDIRTGRGLALDYPWLYRLIGSQESFIAKFSSLPTAAQSDLAFLKELSGSQIGIFPYSIEGGFSSFIIVGGILKPNLFDADLAELFQSTGNYFSYVLQQQIYSSAVFERELKFSSIYDSVSDAILLINKNKVVDCNKAAVNLLGYTNKTSLIAIHPQALLNIDDIFFNNLITSVSNDAGDSNFPKINVTMHKHNDARIEAELHLSAVDIGNERMVLVTIWPKSDHGSSIPLLSFSDDDLRHFLDIITEPAFLLDLHGNLKSINSGGTALLGCAQPDDSLSNLFALDILSAENVLKFNKLLVSVISDGEMKVVEVVTKKSEPGDFHMSVTPLIVNGEKHSLFKLAQKPTLDKAVRFDVANHN